MPSQKLLPSQAKIESISMPEAFFTQVLPRIKDLAELKIVLYVFYLILRKPGHPDFVTCKELQAESGRFLPDLDENTLRKVLNLAVEDGVLSRSTLAVNGLEQDVYSLPAQMYRSGQLPTANIFALYEQNIGIITPLIAEELKEAEKLYPAQWIEEAFKEAVTLNKRSWRYIARILERWASEGKDSGEHKGHTKKGSPNKYIKGRYGHLVQR